MIETWRNRWASAIVHAVGTQGTGVAAAQVRKEAAGKYHGRVPGVAQALHQQTPASGSATARWAFTPGDSTSGQRVRTRARDAWQRLRKRVAQRLAHGHSCAPIVEVYMPVSYVVTNQLDLSRRVRR